jgi:hypothetical protein
MANVAFTRTASIPTYDPREGFGISFHYDTSAERMWFAVAKNSVKNWARLIGGTKSVVSTPVVATFNRDFPIVTTSNLAPDFAPEAVPSDGKIHIHIGYFEESSYQMFIGTGNTEETGNTWAIYDIDATIA